MMVLALAQAELKLLLRNTAVAISALLLPIGVGVFATFNLPDDAGPSAWSMVISIQLLMVLGFTVYFTTTAALAARREDHYLKRLRSGEASDAAILAGLLAPAVVLGLAQLVLLAVISAYLGAPMPANVLPIALALLLGIALCLVGGIATSGRTASSEQAQVTTMPLFFGMIGGVVIGVFSPAGVLLPGGGLAGLVQHAMTGSGPLLPALGSMIGWIVLLSLLAKAWFRWEAR
ncbi:ABC transporter permease [Saccharopolyspora halophila]|uniref:ABC transporter permease n=1 Tax=Saccharopolyspora halophila TaxID=405551 RepID=A0ABN3FJ16_9PSEU